MIDKNGSLFKIAFGAILSCTALGVSAQTAAFSIEATPQTIESGQTITVTYNADPTLHNRDDKIVIWNSDKNKVIEKITVGRNATGSKDIVLWKTGAYEFRYKQYGVGDIYAAASNVVTVAAPDSGRYILDPDQTAPYSGETVTVNYSAPNFAHKPGDTIVLYDLGRNKVIKKREVGSLAAGIKEFTIPKEGVYELQYRMVKIDNQVVARSSQISASVPSAELFPLSVTPMSVVIGEEIIVEYSAPEFAHNRDNKIRMIRESDGKLMSVKSVGVDREGVKTFSALKNGTYYFEYKLATLDNVVVARSESVTVEIPSEGSYQLRVSKVTVTPAEEISVNFVAPETSFDSRDKIRMVDMANDEVVEVRTTGQDSMGSVTFSTRKLGSYRFEYKMYTSGGLIVATSPIVSVALPDPSAFSLSLSPETMEIGRSTEISYAIPERIHSTYDKVQIFDTERNEKVFEKQVGSSSGMITFSTKRVGVYEVRYKLGASGKPVVATSTLVVTLPDASLYNLTVIPPSVAVGQDVSIQYVAPAHAHSTEDKIVLVDTETGETISSVKVGDLPTGSKVFNLRQTGEFVFRYKLGYSGKPVIAESAPFTVTLPNADEYTLVVSSQSLAIGEIGTIQYEAPEYAHSPEDKILVVDTATGNTVFVFRVGSEHVGERQIRFRRIGTYEFRYKMNIPGKPIIKTSNPISIELPPSDLYTLSIAEQEIAKHDKITVSYSGPEYAHNKYDKIVLIKKGSVSNTEVARVSVGDSVSGEKVFTVAGIGTYEFRYLLNISGKPVIKVSDEFVVNYIVLNTVTNYPVTDRTKVIALGDSITAGYEIDESKAFVSRLSTILGVPIENRGVIGDTTSDALARLAADVIDHDPRLVIVLLGANDFKDRVPTSETKANLIEIIDQIHANGSMVLLLSYRDYLLTDYEPLYRDVVDQTGAAFAPKVLNGIMGNIFLTVDLAHPNSAGHKLLAERLAPYAKLLLDLE